MIGPLPTLHAAQKQAKLPKSVRNRALLPDVVHHHFTHFDLELSVAIGKVEQTERSGHWVKRQNLANEALPNVMRKVIRHAIMAENRIS